MTNQTFQLRRSILYQGIGLPLFFACALIGSGAILLVDNPKEHGFKREGSPLVVFAMSVAVWGSMLLLSLYVWAAYYFERFRIEATIFSLRTLVQNHRFDVSELKRLTWRTRPQGGSILLQYLGSKARLDLWGYSKADRLEIVRALRKLVPANLQENWPSFCQTIALSLRDGQSRLVRDVAPDTLVLISRKRYDRAFLFSFPFATLLALTVSAWLNAWQPLLLPIAIIPLWLLLRTKVPHEGELVVPLTSQPGGHGTILLLGGVVMTQLSIVTLRLMGVGKENRLQCGPCDYSTPRRSRVVFHASGPKTAEGRRRKRRAIGSR